VASGDFPSVFPPGPPSAARRTADPPTPSRSGPGRGSPSPTPTRAATDRRPQGRSAASVRLGRGGKAPGWVVPSPRAPRTVPARPADALLETAAGEGGQRAWDWDSSQKTVTESGYHGGPAAVSLREQTWFFFSCFPHRIIFRAAA